ncbi:MAG TPA: ABC transporter permease [Puia sp.]|jgi:putative ABC transport system permease protein|nr:ABC transporter permease [Puia sp.]
MFKNYFKLAIRHLARKKVFSFINIFGLTVGLTSCILIGLFITDELSFDTFHKKAGHIVRVTMEFKKGSIPNRFATTGTKVGPQFKRTFPEVEDYTRTLISRAIISTGTTRFSENQLLYADASFLKLFTFPVLSGDAGSLSQKENILLTASAAKKYFGTTDVLGKILQFDDQDFRISAVLADPPSNSQVQFEFVTSFNNLNSSKYEIWFTANYITYLLLKDGANTAALQQRINNYMQTPRVRTEAGLEPGDYLRYDLQPLTKVHLYSDLDGFTPNFSITYIYVLIAIACLILIIACFNYTNLAIAQSASRTGEIGIRKVLGAAKSQLFTQFTGESLLITFIALILSIAISTQLLPLYNDLTGKHLHATDLLQFRPLFALLVVGTFIGLLAGAYPALVLANTRLINILKSGFRITGGNAGLRRTLIIGQFVISFFLIITTIVILQQMSFIRNTRLGLDRDHVLVVPVDYHLLDRYDAMKRSMKALPGVENISGSYHLPISATWGDGLVADNGHEKVRFSITCIPADLNYLATMNMQLIAGSDFTTADLPENTAPKGDTTTPRLRYILNETAVRRIGWTPQEAIGKIVDKGDRGIIKGVVKDFHFASMHKEIGPLMLFADTQWVRNMLVRVNGSQLSRVLPALQATWKTYVPDQAFDYHFLDEDYNRLYTVETRTASVFTLFSSLAILLACLGLFGLSAITAIQRTKEIGIRKVLGASLLNITLLMARNFILLVGLALLIATPLAWLAASRWLESFAYRVSVQPWVFLLAGAAGIVLAFFTVSFHALRVGSKNPSETLKSE